MKNKISKLNNFNIKAFLFAIIPSYIFPSGMSWVSGWIMDNIQLMQASYTTIAIPSLLAALLAYSLLYTMEKFQFFPVNRLIRTLLLSLITVCLSLIIIEITSLHSESFNILLSSILGSAITTWRQPISIITTKEL
ncbi:hypothetical protein [Aquimarina sediminis]|uniref:hypothetical protein n=1 Tax=Aquimarina sediminis TaxID=2070536 RepID=UPI000CA08148|nr:hypothetical protein [Aquimarina sediminis]